MAAVAKIRERAGIFSLSEEEEAEAEAEAEEAEAEEESCGVERFESL